MMTQEISNLSAAIQILDKAGAETAGSGEAFAVVYDANIHLRVQRSSLIRSYLTGEGDEG